MNETPQPTGLVPEEWRGVAAQISEHAAGDPDRIFLHSLDDGRSLSWGALAGYAGRMGHMLRALGVGANDRIAVLGENSIEYLILYYGIQAFGATYCTINTEINQAHVREMLERLGPKLVLWQSDLDVAGFGFGAPGTWMPFGAHDGDGEGVFAMLASFPAGPPPEPVNGPEDIAVISFTSGTEARPKGVLHSFSNYYAIAEHVRERWGLGASDRVLEVRSFSWASAHMLSLNSTLLTGATLLFARRFSQRRFFDWVRECAPTVVVAVPTVVNMLLERRVQVTEGALSSLRFMSCSTAPLMAGQHRQFEDTYGIRLVQLYGMSEGGVVAANRPSSRRIGSVGPPGLYQDMVIRDGDGAALPAGETGAIEVTSAQAAYGYLLEDGKVERIRGFALRTGDLGYLDGDGFLYITGRAKDVINRGGVNIAPLEIDQVLTSHADVAEAAAIGVPDAVYGEEVAAYVVLRPGAAADADTLRAHCAATLPEAKVPKRIVFIGALARNPRGKIDRGALMEMWCEEHK